MSRGQEHRGSRDSKRSSSKQRSQNRPKSSRTTVRMTKERARAIQRHADKSGKNQDFKARAMSAADKNENEDEE